MIPIPYALHMQEIDNALDGVDVPEDDPVARLFARASVAVAGDTTIAEIARLEKVSAPIRRIESDGNPWITHAEVRSLPVEAAPLTPLPVDELQKRISTSTRKANMVAHIKRQLALGETVESLATFAEAHDPAVAREIREVGAEITGGR